MASQLEKSGEQVSFLALFESALPDTLEFQISPLQRLGVIWQSLPVWLKDYSNMDSTQLLSRLRSTFVRVWAKVQRNPILKRKARVEETLGIDANDLPSRNIELTEIHMQAALQYRPSEYAGTVTLFRARHRSIKDVVLGSLDASMGWRPWAKGGVQVCLVDGFHRNLHLLPYARSLAAELRKQLDIRDAAD